MDEHSFKVRDYSWLMLIALPIAYWVSGWRGGAGLILGWIVTAVNMLLMVQPLKKESETAMVWQVQILKSVLLRYIIIIAALSISVLFKKAGLLWAGGSVLTGHLLLIFSISLKSRVRGESRGN